MRSSTTQDNKKSNSTTVMGWLCDCLGLFTNKGAVIDSQALAKGYVYFSVPMGSDLSQFLFNEYNANTILNNKIISGEKGNSIALSPNPKYGLKSRQFGTWLLCGRRGVRSGDQKVLFALELTREEVVEYAKDKNYPLHQHILWAESASDVARNYKHPEQMIRRVINTGYPWKEKGLDPNKLSKESYRDVNSLNESSQQTKTLKL